MNQELDKELNAWENVADEILEWENTHRVPPAADAYASARIVMQMVLRVRLLLVKNQWTDAVCHAIDLGHAGCELLNALEGSKTLSEAGKRSLTSLDNARRKKLDIAKTRGLKIFAAVKRRLKDHPRDSIDYARRKVAEEHVGERGWSYTQIKRWSWNMKYHLKIKTKPKKS